MVAAIFVLPLAARLSSLAFFPYIAWADDSGPLGFGSAWLTQDMEADRARFTKGTGTVLPGHLQLEAGYDFSYDNNAGIEQSVHRIPDALLRVGVYEDLELRLAWDGYVSRVIPGDSTKDGPGNFQVGIKHRMYENRLVMPDLSFLLELGLPTGDEDVSSNEAEPALSFLWAYVIPKYFSLAGNIRFAAPVQESQRNFETNVSLAATKPLGNYLAGFVEYAGFFQNQDAPDTRPRHQLDGGFMYSLSDNVQLDVRLGLGLNEAADDFLARTGISYRL